jgi:hypothetical protein
MGESKNSLLARRKNKKKHWNLINL